MPDIDTITSLSDEQTVSPHLESLPALWNPNASGCWSLIFTPIFGAYLHMKNWQALGELELAEKSRKWVISSLVFLFALMVSSAMAPESSGLDAFFRFSGIAFIVSWYYAIGKSQQIYVKARYGNGYVRRGWSRPLMVALLGLAIFYLIIFAVAYVSATER